MSKGAKKTQGGPPPKPVTAPPTPAIRCSTPLAMKTRIASAVGYDLRPYVAKAKKAKKKGK
jgi:hypothetical protein